MFDTKLGEMGNMLLKLRKGAFGGFNAKKVAEMLALFPGWTMTAAVMIKQSNEGRNFAEQTSVMVDHPAIYRDGKLVREAHQSAETMIPFTMIDETDGIRSRTLRLEVTSYAKVVADALHAKIASFAVDALPDPKKAKADDYFVMNLSPVTETMKEKFGSTSPHWVLSFDLFRKCRGHIITAPNGQTFDVCGPDNILGYGGAIGFDKFFAWAFANTDLEDAICTKLGMTRHVKASERPRVPVGSQVLGTCAICGNTQVTHDNKMVNHGYERPGIGFLIGPCFGVGYDAYEISAEACVAYIPVLERTKARYELRLGQLQSGKIKVLSKREYNRKTGEYHEVAVKQGEKDFDKLMAIEIANTETQISHTESYITTMNKRIAAWKPGTLQTNQ